jgi:hypothetical protein
MTQSQREVREIFSRHFEANPPKSPFIKGGLKRDSFSKDKLLLKKNRKKNFPGQRKRVLTGVFGQSSRKETAVIDFRRGRCYVDSN